MRTPGGITRHAHWAFLANPPAVLLRGCPSPSACLTQFVQRLLAAEKCSYWKQYQEGTLVYDVAQTLMQNVDRIMSQSGNFFGLDGLRKHWMVPSWTQRLPQLWGMEGAVSHVLVSHFRFGYALGLGLVEMLEELSQVLHRLIEDHEVYVVVLRNLRLTKDVAITHLQEVRPSERARTLPGPG